ncbi:Nuclear pore complex protein Nup214 [Araneus ventricosus]|uniref:Nuclear pore complex protein Nup214 n=1 Tax=Araneus ventricosus TaxID=182803 RepID=A0A4Y2RZL5_ARAVE|nr:Nuclear pore complex protein Nup214 [Araneus ventricosus]
MKVKIYFRSSPSFAQSPPMGSMNAAAFSTGSLTFGLSQANSQQSFQPAPQIVNVASLAPSSVPSSSMQFGAPSSMNMSSEMERFHKPSKGVSFVAPTQTVARDNSGVRHMAVAQRTAPDFKGEGDRIIQSNSAVPSMKMTQVQAPLSNSMMVKESLHSQDTYRVAICEEMQTFEKEIQDLKKLSGQLGSIGMKEEMAQLQSFTMNFEEFNNDMSETMVSLNNDIHSLKNILLESFVLVEQAHSKERRKNDHSYISMLRERALDPLTAKRMQKIEQHYLYLSTQLQEVNNKLDQDWFEYLEKKKANQRSIRHISSAEAMYKTVVNNQKIIHNLRQIINSMSNQLVEKRLQNLSKRKNKTEFIKRSGPEELSKLADAFLQAKITSSEEEKPQLPKKMPFSAQQALKNYLSNSPVTVVRPTIVSSPAQSRLLSKSLLYKESIMSRTSDETDIAVTVRIYYFCLFKTTKID